MNKSLVIAAVVGIGIGAASPVLLRSISTSEPLRAKSVEPVALANADTSAPTIQAAAEPPAVQATEPAAVEPVAPAVAAAPQTSNYQEAVEAVERENAKLAGAQKAYFDHTAEVRKESDALYKQEQAQGNIRAQENLAEKKVQAQIDQASEQEYNSQAYWNNWSEGDWNHVNRFSNGYIYRP